MNKNTRIPSLLMAVFTLALIIPIGLSMNTIALTPQGLDQEVAQKITQTGVSNPVTAVLLNFRSFDTLLEVDVLLVALLTTQAIVNSKAQAVLPDFNVDDSILRGGIRIIAPLVFLIAGYILWVGGKAPGGAFQSGALLSSLMVLL